MPTAVSRASWALLFLACFSAVAVEAKPPSFPPIRAERRVVVQVKREPVELHYVATADFTPTRQQIAQLEAQLPKVVTSFNWAEIDEKWNRYALLYWGTGKGHERKVVLFATEWDEFHEGKPTLDGIYPKIFTADGGCTVFWAQLVVESGTVGEFRCNGGGGISEPYLVRPERRVVIGANGGRLPSATTLDPPGWPLPDHQSAWKPSVLTESEMKQVDAALAKPECLHGLPQAFPITVGRYWLRYLGAVVDRQRKVLIEGTTWDPTRGDVTDAGCDHFKVIFDLEHNTFEQLSCDGIA
jgi:hypothetical protein